MPAILMPLFLFVYMLWALLSSGAVVPTNAKADQVQSALKAVMIQANDLSSKPNGWSKTYSSWKLANLMSATIVEAERQIVLDQITIMEMRPIPVILNKAHTVASGHLEAEDIRNTLGCKGPSEIWRTKFLGEDRYFLVCQIEAPGKKWNGKWGFQIITKGANNSWNEITAFIKSRGIYDKLVEWFANSGYTPVDFLQ